MKKAKSLLCIILVFTLLFNISSTSFALFDEIGKGLWDTAWAHKTESDDSAVTMFVGSDENDRTIAWY